MSKEPIYLQTHDPEGFIMQGVRQRPAPELPEGIDPVLMEALQIMAMQIQQLQARVHKLEKGLL